METILEEDCFDMAPNSSSTPSESPNEEAQEIPIGVALGFAVSSDPTRPFYRLLMILDVRRQAHCLDY